VFLLTQNTKGPQLLILAHKFLDHKYLLLNALVWYKMGNCQRIKCVRSVCNAGIKSITEKCATTVDELTIMD